MKSRLDNKYMPQLIDSFTDTKKEGQKRYKIEYDNLEFEGSTINATINKVLKYLIN